jgi:murein DD-endopeptidase MepM/ murein hydrolase activator NlpD
MQAHLKLPAMCRQSRPHSAAALIMLVAVFLSACSAHGPAPVRLKGTSGSGTAKSGVFGSGPSVVSVLRGDTVYGISRRTGASVRSIIDRNNLRPPYRLKPGQTLRIPGPMFHLVRKGETLYSVSRRYGVDMASLARANYIRRPYPISVGQKLTIPGRTVGSVKTAAKSPRVSRPQKSRKKPLPAPPKRAGKQFSWPVRGKLLSSFGPKPGGLHNDGINISVKQGTNVLAAENGVVAYSGNELRGFGNLILVRHAGGWVTAYAHNQRLLVKRGDRIKRKQVIAKSGSTGSVKTPQLHFEIRKGSTAVNPRKHLSASLAPDRSQAIRLASATSASHPTRRTDPG